MHILQRIGIAIVLIATAVIAIYVFAWLFLILLIAAPFLYLWWKRRIRKGSWKTQQKSDGTIVIKQLR